MYDLDNIIGGIAKRLGYTYSRYADDMCFALRTSDLKSGWGSWSEIEKKRRINNRGALIKLVEMALDREGMRLSKKKTQISFLNSPRVPRRITGVTIRKDGKGYNAPKKLRKKARNLTHILWKKLQEGIEPKLLWPEYRQLLGIISYCDNVRAASEEGYNDADPYISAVKFNYIRERFNDGRANNR